MPSGAKASRADAHAATALRRSATPPAKLNGLAPPMPLQRPQFGLLLRKCACGGDCPRCRQESEQHSGLTISMPGDRFEREADRIADQVMRMPDSEGDALPAAAGRESELPAARDARGSWRDGGEPLSATLRAFFEPRLNRDLGHVRIQTDAEASASAQAVGAHAYTLGRDVVFAAGKYAPETSEGRRLLAHELTHVIQQGEGPSATTLQRQEATEEQADSAQSGGGTPPQVESTQGGVEYTGCEQQWESDLQGFTKVIAEFYVRDALKMTGQGTSVQCPDSEMCLWDVSTAKRNIKVGVSLHWVPNFVLALGGNAGKRCYGYKCSSNGGLTLTPRACPP